MGKILIISDNEVLNSLYSVNLKIYTNTESIVASTLDEAIEIIEDESSNLSMVLSLCMIGEDDTALVAYHHLIENGLEIPITVLGKQSEVPDEIDIVANVYDVKGIIQSVAKGLSITAQQMAELETPNYYPMPIRMFFSLNCAPCDTFYKVRNSEGNEEFHKIFQNEEAIWPKVKSYIDEGVSVLYVPSDARFIFAKQVTVQLIDDLNGISKESSEVGEKLEKVEQGIEAIAEQFFDDPVAKEVIELSNKCMDVMEDVIAEVPDLKSLLKELMSNKASFLYTHSIMAGYVSDHILQQIEWGSKAHKEKLKFVLFFHDMYLVSVYKKHPELMYEESLIFDQNLTEEEKEVVVSHAAEAAEAIKRYPKAPMGVDAIIRQHHGTSNGLGFATSYKDDISPLAKVLIIAESFAEEVLKTMHAGEKVDVGVIMESLSEKFTRRTYIKIIKTLKDIKL